jgi:ABC-type antimicrobial peptide transport system permease subunit
MSLLPFLLIEVLGVAFILGSLAYSSFLERKKEAAILWALGARKDDTALLYEGGLVSHLLPLGRGPRLVASFPFERLLSSLLEKHLSIPGLIRIPYFSYFGIPFLPILALFLFAFFTSLLGASLPLHLAMKANLAEELRDE